MASSSFALTEGYYTYTTNSNGQATIIDFFELYSGQVSIPSTLRGCPVVSIGEHAFDYCYSLTSVTIPNSITSIGNSAFLYCYRLTSITIPDSVTSIDVNAFWGCTGLTGISIPSSVTRIEKGAFCGCSGLSSVTIPNGVTSINRSTFSSCSKLSSITIPDSVTSINYAAFAQCTSLVNVTIPHNVTNIGEFAFWKCTSMTNVTLPDCIINIEKVAFSECTSLTSVTIPDSVTSIGDYVFGKCIGLTSATIPKSVTSIGNGVFSYCSSLTSIAVDSANANYCSLNGGLFNNIQTSIIGYPAGKTGSYIILGNVTNIGESSFQGCTGLTDVSIPSSVTNIANVAFRDCSGLQSIFFLGNAPSLGGTNVFLDTPATIYYLPGKTGWTNPWGGRPTVCGNSYFLPSIVSGPTNLTVKGGTRASFSVVAGGAGPHTYQWRKGLSNITGATNSTLTIDIASAYDAGNYSVKVYNNYSLLGATSSSAKLTVLGGEMYSQTSCQMPEPVPFEKLPGQDSLIVITHGWQPLGALADVSWMEDMADAIRANLAIQGKTNWRVETYNWTPLAWPDFETALINGNTLGGLLGMKLGGQSWNHIHLIGHSAGAAFIQSATEWIKWLSPDTTVHTTFLDPYIGVLNFGIQRYGLNADFSENYFSDEWTGHWSGTRLQHAHNVNVTQLDPDHTGGLPVFTSGSSMPSSTPAVIASQEESSHPYPHDFYLSTIELRCSPEADGYGFPLSKEGGGWDNRANYQPNNAPEILGEPAARIQGFEPSVTTGTALDFNSLANVSSDTGATVLSCALQLSCTQSAPSQHSPAYMMQYAEPLSDPSSTAWLSAAVTVTSAVNFVSCDIAFTSPDYAQGLLTVYWETNVIATVDERAVLTGSGSYRFSLADTFPAGTYALGFRLDSFTNITSSVTVTNVAAGFAGNASPMSLDVSSTNNGMFMTLSGPSPYNYLVEASTNLVDWTPFAILANTNGAVMFYDPDAANYKQRFYRTVRP